MPRDPRPEFDLIDWIRERSANRPEVVLGIGDDASILAECPGQQWVTAVDVLMEGVHFDSQLSPELIGRKSLAVNLSDLAAMAAEPVAAYIGIVLPKLRGREFAEHIYKGLFDIAQQFNLAIAGGDTNTWNGPLVISVTVLGLVSAGQGVRRAGAAPGDWLFVTGALGGSLASLRHAKFSPRVTTARALAQEFKISSMIDVSDGLSSDLRHLVKESDVGFIVEAEQIPIHSDVDETAEFEDRLQHALTDGEDFELLFTVNANDGTRLAALGQIQGVSVTKIGECIASPDLLLRQAATIQPFPTGGWGHLF